MAKETSICGVTLFSADEQEFEETNAHLTDLIKQRIIKPVIGKIYDLADMAQAHAEVINNSGTTGRITIKI
jgi:NADPH:quinone reductase-like Zn-dependent oxidoreductase